MPAVPPPCGPRRLCSRFLDLQDEFTALHNLVRFYILGAEAAAEEATFIARASSDLPDWMRDLAADRAAFKEAVAELEGSR